MTLLEELLSLSEDRGRDGQADRPSGRKIDDQLNVGWLLDGQIGRLSPLHDLVDVLHGTSIPDERIRSVRHQATDHGESSGLAHGRYPGLPRHLGSLNGMAIHQ